MDTNMLRRTISNQLWGSSNNPSSRATMLLMAFGQFVDHDIAHVPFSQEIDCCDEEGNVKSDEDDCFPIKEGGAFRRHSVHLGNSVEPSFLGASRYDVRKIVGFLTSPSFAFGTDLYYKIHAISLTTFTFP